jgi:hypothetical protein
MSRTVKLKRKPNGADYLGFAGYRVKLFRHLGVYPRGTFCTPSGLFHADEDIVFAVTVGATWEASSELLPYSEADWLQPQLIRLLGALMFTEQFPEGLRCWFYPQTHGDFLIDEVELDLMDERSALAVKKALQRTINNRLWPKWIQQNWSAYLGHEFHLFDRTELSLELLHEYWEALNTENFVLLRGIQALIKSDMLAMHAEFLEEASIATFIALDASFELVLRHLRVSGLSNASAKDAGTWLYKTFDEPLGIHGGKDFKYYEKFYEQRVQTVHPGSRFGDSPVAPVSASDRKHLRQALPGAFAYLALGKHSTHFFERVAEFESRQPPSEESTR